MRWRRTVATFALVTIALAARADAHEVRPGYLAIRQIGPDAYKVLWKQPVIGDYRLPLDPVFPRECTVRRHEGPTLGPRAVVDAILVSGTLTCPGGLAGKTIAIAGLDASVTDVLIRVEHADGRQETELLRPTSPSVTFAATSSAVQRAWVYARLGIEHILLGVDHLLFVLGLVLIVRSRSMLLKTITAFTLAHSITLAVATLGYASAPLPPLNAAIALSIFVLGPEIVRVWRGESSFTIRHPWVVAFAFGLLHGFGFASGLTAMGLPRADVPLALLLFNIGVEIGQVGFVALILLLIRAFKTLEIRWPRAMEALPAYSVGSLGAFWTIQRTIVLLGTLR